MSEWTVLTRHRPRQLDSSQVIPQHVRLGWKQRKETNLVECIIVLLIRRCVQDLIYTQIAHRTMPVNNNDNCVNMALHATRSRTVISARLRSIYKLYMYDRPTIRVHIYTYRQASARKKQTLATEWWSLFWPTHSHTSPNRTSRSCMTCEGDAGRVTVIVYGRLSLTGSSNTFHTRPAATHHHTQTVYWVSTRPGSDWGQQNRLHFG